MSDDPLPPFQPNYYGGPPGGPLPAGMAIASMVCGIVSIPLICVWFASFPLAVVAVTLGLIARGRARRGVAAGGGMATAGVACGGVTLGLFALVIGLFVVLTLVRAFHR